MDDLYDKIKEDIQFRRTWAESADSVSNCPHLYRFVPKNEGKSKSSKAG